MTKNREQQEEEKPIDDLVVAYKQSGDERLAEQIYVRCRAYAQGVLRNKAAEDPLWNRLQDELPGLLDEALTDALREYKVKYKDPRGRKRKGRFLGLLSIILKRRMIKALKFEGKTKTEDESKTENQHEVDSSGMTANGPVTKGDRPTPIDSVPDPQPLIQRIIARERLKKGLAMTSELSRKALIMSLKFSYEEIALILGLDHSPKDLIYHDRQKAKEIDTLWQDGHTVAQRDQHTQQKGEKQWTA